MRLVHLADDPFVLFARSASSDYYARIINMGHESWLLSGHAPRGVALVLSVLSVLSVVAVVVQGMGAAVVPASLQGAGIAAAVFRPLGGVAPSRVF